MVEGEAVVLVPLVLHALQAFARTLLALPTAVERTAVAMAVEEAAALAPQAPLVLLTACALQIHQHHKHGPISWALCTGGGKLQQAPINGRIATLVAARD